VSWPHQAEYAFEYDESTRAAAVAVAVEQEVGDIDDDRSRARLELQDSTVTIQVDAADRTALRAATNTWLGLVRVAEDTAAVATEQD